MARTSEHTSLGPGAAWFLFFLAITLFLVYKSYRTTLERYTPQPVSAVPAAPVDSEWLPDLSKVESIHARIDGRGTRIRFIDRAARDVPGRTIYYWNEKFPDLLPVDATTLVNRDFACLQVRNDRIVVDLPISDRLLRVEPNYGEYLYQRLPFCSTGQP